ncbi:transposase [Bradyrhizobium sp. CCBAU 11357]|nr:transposase [Bradyrhizobium sp. CCBAU 11357]
MCPGSTRSRCGSQSCGGQSLSGTSFTSPKQLQEHIDAYVNAYNDKAEPFVWTKKKIRQRHFKGRRITQL